METDLDPGGMSDPERLQALKDSGLLRHDPLQRLDLLCETACTILQAPLSQVNALDGEFQTSVGRWPPDMDIPVKTPVDDTSCKEVVLSKEPLVVPNTLLHPILCVRPFVQMAGVRAYLGVPVFYDGQVIGAFCVADFKVREWTTWDTAGLQGLARLAGLAVTNA